MKLAGKVVLEVEKFEKLYEAGFRNFELKLFTSILDNNSVNEIV